MGPNWKRKAQHNKTKYWTMSYNSPLRGRILAAQEIVEILDFLISPSFGRARAKTELSKT